MDPESFAALDAALELAIAPWQRGPEPTVVLFSGGIDSGFLAWELRRAPRVTLFTVGLEGTEDLRRAETAAPDLGLPWVGRSLSDDDLERAVRMVGPDDSPAENLRRGIFVALAAAIDRAPVGRLVCGQGADELFLGYAHFRGLDPAGARERAEDDLRRLQELDWPRTVALAERSRRTIGAPFLDPRFVAAVGAVPIDERVPAELTKPLLRRWAQHRGVPEALVARPKRAIQYGTGVDRWLRRREPEPR